MLRQKNLESAKACATLSWSHRQENMFSQKYELVKKIVDDPLYIKYWKACAAKGKTITNGPKPAGV